MPDAPTPLDLDAIEADLDERSPARDLGDRNHARALIAEVERLRAEVARLTARPAPVWDEEAVRARASNIFREFLYAGSGDPEDEISRAVTAVLAVVRERLPVKPGREAVARAIDPEAFSDWSNAHDPRARAEQEARRGAALRSADKALDLWPGRSEAEVKREGIREAADAWHAENQGTRPGPYRFLWSYADRLAAEGGDDRG